MKDREASYKWTNSPQEERGAIKLCTRSELLDPIYFIEGNFNLEAWWCIRLNMDVKRPQSWSERNGRLKANKDI